VKTNPVNEYKKEGMKEGREGGRKGRKKGRKKETKDASIIYTCGTNHIRYCSQGSIVNNQK